MTLQASPWQSCCRETLIACIYHGSLVADPCQVQYCGGPIHCHGCRWWKAAYLAGVASQLMSWETPGMRCALLWLLLQWAMGCLELRKCMRSSTSRLKATWRASLSCLSAEHHVEAGCCQEISLGGIPAGASELSEISKEMLTGWVHRFPSAARQVAIPIS